MILLMRDLNMISLLDASKASAAAYLGFEGSKVLRQLRALQNPRPLRSVVIQGFLDFLKITV